MAMVNKQQGPEMSAVLPTEHIFIELMERLYSAQCFDYDLIDLVNVMVECLPDGVNDFPDARSNAVHRFLSQLSLTEEQQQQAAQAVLDAMLQIDAVLWSLGIYLNSNNTVRFIRFYYRDMAIMIS
jgi:uncharacterized protein YycO